MSREMGSTDPLQEGTCHPAGSSMVSRVAFGPGSASAAENHLAHGHTFPRWPNAGNLKDHFSAGPPCGVTWGQHRSSPSAQSYVHPSLPQVWLPRPLVINILPLNSSSACSLGNPTCKGRGEMRPVSELTQPRQSLDVNPGDRRQGGPQPVLDSC